MNPGGFSPSTLWMGAIIFGVAILHTFFVKKFHDISTRFKEGSVGENLFHLLGEVEIVFGLWAAVLFILMTFAEGVGPSIHYLESRNFTEPAFVFVVLAVCSTRPILGSTESFINWLANSLPFSRAMSFYVTCLVIGPILGSLITEPAAMTVTAILLMERFFEKNISQNFKYSTLATLFVNISVGGTLTPYAAPPILMVASKWEWNLSFMFFNYGWKGILTCLVTTALVAFIFRDEINQLPAHDAPPKPRAPNWVCLTHLIFLGFIVVSAHHPILVIGLFLFFLGFLNVTEEFQKELRLKKALLVAFFLGGLVVIGGLQGWWLEPIIIRLSELPLYLGAISLTAFTDNAALTYLGSLVPNLSDASKYSLVAGAVVGGGLTVIANAPNPAGYSILLPSFGKEGISPLRLLFFALLPTSVAAVIFWCL